MIRLARITHSIHSIDGMDHPWLHHVTPCVVEEDSAKDLTLVDTCFVKELPKLEAHLRDEGYDIRDDKRLVLTHTHPDHVQAALEIKKISGARIYCHWAEADYLEQDPPFRGPLNPEMITGIFSKLGIKMDDVAKKFGNFDTPFIIVDGILRDGDAVGRKLRVIHTPGHTPGHISLFSEQERTVIGGDFLMNVSPDGVVAGSEYSIDPIAAAISARRVSQFKFDKLLVGHQDSPLVENAQKEVERAAYAVLRKH